MTTEEERRFKLNRNDGVDTLHAEHPHEECNVDDSVGTTFVDEMTAEAMVAGPISRWRSDSMRPPTPKRIPGVAVPPYGDGSTGCRSLARDARGGWA